LILVFNELGDEGTHALANSIGSLTHLTHLDLDLKYNSIQKGAITLGENLEKLLGLKYLNIDFGGYSVHKNNIKTEGAT